MEPEEPTQIENTTNLVQSHLQNSVVKFLIIVVLLTLIGSSGWVIYTTLRDAGEITAPSVEEIEEFATFPVELPTDFRAGVFAENITNARVLVFDPKGRVVVSQPKEGKVIALPDENKDGKADKVLTVVEGLTNPHGMFFRCVAGGCNLYIAEEDKVSVYPYDSDQARVVGQGKTVVSLPKGGINTTRNIISYEEDGKARMFISSSSSCNVCDEEDDNRARIFTVNLDGTDFREYARGLRDTSFMAVHPKTGELWATENGRELLGDDTPPDELNIILEDRNYGWPNCYGKNTHDVLFDKNTYIRSPCQDPFEVSSFLDIPAHSAPLGLAFIPEEGFSSEYRGDLLVVYSGSSERSRPNGYKIVRVDLDEEGNLKSGQRSVSDFATGWISDGRVLGSPVDVLVHPKDGTIFISDDKAEAIYKISYTGRVDPIIVEDEVIVEPAGRCIRAGCSGVICVDASKDIVVTTCEYRSEYACYQSAVCERQQSGECGWTQTTELVECLVEEKGISI